MRRTPTRVLSIAQKFPRASLMLYREFIDFFFFFILTKHFESFEHPSLTMVDDHRLFYELNYIYSPQPLRVLLSSVKTYNVRKDMKFNMLILVLHT